MKASTMHTTYVLIDYENVHPTDITMLQQEHFRIIVFLGASQVRIQTEFALTLQQMGHRGMYIKISGNGPNALDFHIAFYIGMFAAREPEAYFYIISNDTGFDPLVKHLTNKKIYTFRLPSIREIPVIRPEFAETVKEKLLSVTSYLQRRGISRPATTRKLASTINALFQKELLDEELAVIIRELQRQRVISIKETRVSYHFPP